MLQDGLHSLRGMSDGNDMLSAQAYSPYGEPMFTDMPTDFGFTDEQTDPANDLVYLRARYLNPKLGVFGSLDPFEGDESEPLTWNGYGWVEGNTPNLTDASGMSTGTCQAPSTNLSPSTNGRSSGLASSPPESSSSYDFWAFIGSIVGLQQGNGAKSQFISNTPENPNGECGIGSIKVFCKALGGGGGGALGALAVAAAGAWAMSGSRQLTPSTSLDSSFREAVDTTQNKPLVLEFAKEDLNQVRGIARQMGFVSNTLCDQYLGGFIHGLKDSGTYGTKNDRGDFTPDELQNLIRSFLCDNPQCDKRPNDRDCNDLNYILIGPILISPFIDR